MKLARIEKEKTMNGFEVIFYFVVFFVITLAPIILVFHYDLFKKSSAHRIVGIVVCGFSSFAVLLPLWALAYFCFYGTTGWEILFAIVAAPFVSWGGAFVAGIIFLYTRSNAPKG